MYEPTVDGLRLNGYDAVFITTTDATDATRRRTRLGGKKWTCGYQYNDTISGLASRVNGYDCRSCW